MPVRRSVVAYAERDQSPWREPRSVRDRIRDLTRSHRRHRRRVHGTSARGDSSARRRAPSCQPSPIPPLRKVSFGCPRYSDAATMLESEELDAVIIANPNALHVDTAIQCLEAGVAVHLEKPVAVDYPQSLRLVGAVTRLNGRLLVGHHRRHHPAVARARAAIQAGEIGQIVAVSGLWSARKQDGYFTEAPWHRQRGAGVMLINLVHDLDLLRHLCGEVAEIQAMVSSHARNLEVEDTVSVNLRFEGRRRRQLSGLGRRGLSVGLGPVHRGNPASSRFFPMAWRIRSSAPAVPCRCRISPSTPTIPRCPPTGTPPSPAPTFRSLPADRSTRSSSISSRSRRGTAEPLVSAEDASRTLALVEAGALAAQTDQTVDVARFRADAAATAGVSATPDERRRS